MWLDELGGTHLNEHVLQIAVPRGQGCHVISLETREMDTLIG